MGRGGRVLAEDLNLEGRTTYNRSQEKGVPGRGKLQMSRHCGRRELGISEIVKRESQLGEEWEGQCQRNRWGGTRERLVGQGPAFGSYSVYSRDHDQVFR